MTHTCMVLVAKASVQMLHLGVKDMRAANFNVAAFISHLIVMKHRELVQSINSDALLVAH